MTPDQSWFPPSSLTNPHWRVEILHVDGSWRWYTEHHTHDIAETFCRYKQDYYPTHQWRVTESAQ